MTNKYAGTCRKCGREVAPGKGNVIKDASGKWIVTHANCNSTIPKSTTPKPDPKPTPKSTPQVEGEYSVSRKSAGKADSYETGEVVRSKGYDGYHYGVVIEAGKYRDDDTDEWMCTARVRPASEAESAPDRERREVEMAAKASAKILADTLRASKVMGEIDARLYHPKDVVDIWAEQRGAGSERWSYSPSTDIIYYTESSYDDGPATWATTATREQVEALKTSGLYRPSLLEAK